MKEDKPVIVRTPKKVIVKTGMIDGSSAEPRPAPAETPASVRAEKRKRLGFKS